MELIKINISEGGKNVVSARELHLFLEVSTRFDTWFSRKCEQYEFKMNEDFCAILGESTGGRPSTDYMLKMDMAKELSMLEGNEKGKQARKYFIECEKRSQIIRPKSRLELAKENLSLIEEIEEKDRLLLEAQPKAEFYDQVTGSKGTIDIGQAAKVLNLGFGRTTLFQKLRELGVLMGNNNPMQKHIDNGWFRVVESKYNKPDGSTHISLKTVVYQKGLDGIRKLLAK